MAIFTVAYSDGHLRSPALPDQDIRLPLDRILRRQSGTPPVVIMVHGYSHHPHLPHANPARDIFAADTNAAPTRSTSWPLAMGFDQPSSGLCIPFAWPGRIDRNATPWQRLNRFTTIYQRASEAGHGLSRLITWVREVSPHALISVLAHSLGARTATTAVLKAPPNSVTRLILLGGAMFASEARAARNHSPDTCIFNVTARENDLFDWLFEAIAPRDLHDDHGLGIGIGGPRPNWHDIQIDHPDLLRILAGSGIGFAAPRQTISHTGFYDRPGVMAFYHRLLTTGDDRWIADICHEISQLPPEPRGARLSRIITRLKARPGSADTGNSRTS